MDHPATYEEDIYAWSQHQAAILRRLAAAGRAGLPNDLDLENVAEEIESVGRSELTAVRSHLTVMLVHLIKAVSSPEAYPTRLWLGEATRAQGEAADAFTPAMRQHLDPGAVWRRALKDAAAALRAHGEAMAKLPDACPFTLDELLNREVEAEAYAAKLAALVSAATPS
jgi:hypothetical protein